MTKNFYWRYTDPDSHFDDLAPDANDDPAHHIGKLFDASFLWAQEPEEVIQTCIQNMDEYIIEDDHGALLTGREFINTVKWDQSQTDSVGEWFS